MLIGYFCKVGVNTSKPSSDSTGHGGICNRGYECPVGTGDPSPCKPGYYAPVNKMESCLICLAGECSRNCIPCVANRWKTLCDF